MKRSKSMMITATAGLLFGLAGAGIAQNTNSSNSNNNSNRGNSNRGNMNSNSNRNDSNSSNSNRNNNSNNNSNSDHSSHSNMSGGSMNGNNNARAGMGGAAMLDMKFAMDAAYGNNAEIAAGQMALDKSQNSDVRAFAQMMIDHHTQANADLARMANGMTLPSGLDPHHRAVADGMSKLSGMDFDMAYVKGQVADHAMAMHMYDDYEDDGKNRELKNYAKKTLPVVKRHFEQIKAIDMRMAGATTTMSPR